MRKKAIQLDLVKRKNLVFIEIFKRVIACIMIHRFFIAEILHLLVLKNFKVFKKCAQSSIRNYCIFSRRSRGLCNFFGVSRILIRDMSAKGLFFGVKKAS